MRPIVLKLLIPGVPELEIPEQAPSAFLAHCLSCVDQSRNAKPRRHASNILGWQSLGSACLELVCCLVHPKLSKPNVQSRLSHRSHEDSGSLVQQLRPEAPRFWSANFGLLRFVDSALGEEEGLLSTWGEPQASSNFPPCSFLCLRVSND